VRGFCIFSLAVHRSLGIRRRGRAARNLADCGKKTFTMQAELPPQAHLGQGSRAAAPPPLAFV
jgi:hypothetical protein